LSSRFDAVIRAFLQETPPTSFRPVRLDGLDGLNRQGGVPLDTPVAPQEHSAPAALPGEAPPTEATPLEPCHVAEALPFLRMPLDVFARAGASLEVRVPWLDVTLWIVPADRNAVALMAEGVQRGRIWTAAELMQFMAIADRNPETVKTVTHAKTELDGEITRVRPRADSR
jgi:hypothetical protein